jgi:hypothetical protein
MNEEKIVEIWTLFKEYLDKKQIEVIAERYVDLLADYGVTDDTLKESVGSDTELDNAIFYYLDLDEESYDEDDYGDWDE